jgi:histidinol-phosphate aminotransferase
MSDLEALIRPHILALKPYTSARDDFQGPASIFLDANENSLGSPLPGADLSRYPDPHQLELKQALAAQTGVPAGQMFLGNGSDEAIDLLLRACCDPGDNVVLLPPTYGMYAVQAAIHGVEIRRVPLGPDFAPDAAAVLAAADQRSKLLFLCSPNNPTGNVLPHAFVEAMLAGFPGLVVVDEAYIDFATTPSWTARLAEFPRLVVLQTLSKAWGLAGLRVGMAYGHPAIIGVLNKIKFPYNLGTLAIEHALIALQNREAVHQAISVLLAERTRLERELPELPCVQHVFPSEANFLLVRTSDADGLYRYLSEHGIIVRNRSREVHCEGCLRITVGTPAENSRLLEVLHTYP